MAQQLTAEQVGRVFFEQKLGAALPMEATFTDETGRTGPLRTWIHDRPAVVVFAYWSCPAMCNVVLGSLVEGLRTLSASVGRDFDVVVIGIDPSETPAQAAQAKGRSAQRYGRFGSEAGWHFLTGHQDAIAAATGAAGFHYFREPVTGQYAHPSGLLVASPSGKISRYLLGVEFPGRELQASLAAARNESVGERARELLLLCFRDGGAQGRYGRAIQVGLRTAGGLTVAGMAVGIVWLQRRRRRPEA